MKPDLAHTLRNAATLLMTRIAPALASSPHLSANASTTAMLILFAAQEADRAADVLAKENAALRRLFSDAADRDLPEDLGAALNEAALRLDETLRVSALEAANAGFKTLLIALHAAVEEIDADWARDLDRRIWAVLRDGARARALALPGG
jgi:hypothetical protein